MTLERYLFRVYRTREPGEVLKGLFLKPFTTPRLRLFCHYWNPVYGYWLGQIVYRPLARVLPQGAASLLVFVVSGLVLHDVPLMILGWLIRGTFFAPIVVFMFVTFWFLMTLEERLGLSRRSWTPWLNVLWNLGAVAFSAMAPLTVRDLLR